MNDIQKLLKKNLWKNISLSFKCLIGEAERVNDITETVKKLAEILKQHWETICCGLNLNTLVLIPCVAKYVRQLDQVEERIIKGRATVTEKLNWKTFFSIQRERRYDKCKIMYIMKKLNTHNPLLSPQVQEKNIL